MLARLRSMVLTSALALVPACDRCDRAMASARPAHLTPPRAAPALATPAVVAAPAASAAPSAPAPAGLTAAAPTAPPPAVQGVILLTIDALRADQPWTGYPRPVAPELTALARRGVVYTEMYSLSSSTSMSLGALLAGMYPSEVVRDGQLFNRYPREADFLAERLHDAGVHTGAGHAHFYFAHGYAGFDQGFERYEVLGGLHPDFTTVLDVTSDRQEPLARRVLTQLAGAGDQRFFAWFHFMDPHDRYLPHPGIGPYGHGPRDPYDAEVTFTDRHVGALVRWVQAQPWGARTAVVITADHGEAFGEHDDWHHGFEVWQPLIHVPMIVLVPGAAPRVIDARRSHVDLAPTIASLLGVAPSPNWRGVSLTGELRGGAVPQRDVLVEVPETAVSQGRRALFTGEYKVVEWDDRRTAVYALASDPGELHPVSEALAAPARARFAAMRASLHELIPSAVRTRRRRHHAH